MLDSIRPPASLDLSARGFQYLHLDIRVESPADHLAWLEEFLSPHFEGRPADSFAVTVRVQEETHAYESALLRGPLSDHADLDCFVNDSHVVKLPRWRSDEDATSVFQESLRVLYRVQAGGRSISLLSREGNLGVRTALMRVVRELAMSHSRQTGGVFLHGAALSLGPGGLMIVGPKYAGKTTLLSYLLRETGGRYVSNDRLLVPHGDPRTVRGMPTIITLRRATLERLTVLHRAIVDRGYHYHRTFTEVARGDPLPAPWADGSLGLSPAQFCAALGVGSQATCTPSLLLFPRVTSGAGAGKLRAVPRERAAERLRQCLLAGTWPNASSELFAVPLGPSSGSGDDVKDICRELVGGMLCLECELGEASYDSGALAAECVRAMA